jgi:hypothetical protein
VHSARGSRFHPLHIRDEVGAGDDQEAPELVPLVSQKRRAAAIETETVSLPPKKRSVKFSDETPVSLGKSTSAAEQRARMFAAAGAEEPVAANKAMRKAQKADRKRQIKESRKAMEVETVGGLGDAMAVDDIGGDGQQAYDFKQFFGSAPPLPAEDEDEDEEEEL